MLRFLTVLQQLLRDRPRDQDGAAMAEYGLLITAIGLVVALAAATLGTQVAAMFATVAALF